MRNMPRPAPAVRCRDDENRDRSLQDPCENLAAEGDETAGQKGGHGHRQIDSDEKQIDPPAHRAGETGPDDIFARYVQQKRKGHNGKKRADNLYQHKSLLTE